jgi:hypothetical protein
VTEAISSELAKERDRARENLEGSVQEILRLHQIIRSLRVKLEKMGAQDCGEELEGLDTYTRNLEKLLAEQGELIADLRARPKQNIQPGH